MKLISLQSTLILLVSTMLIGCGGDGSWTKAKNDPNATTTINGVPAGTANLSVQGTAPGSLSTGTTTALIQGQTTPTTLDIPVTDMAGASIGTLILTDARIGLKDFKLKLAESEMDGVDENGEGDEDEADIAVKTEENEKVKFAGPYIVDLITDKVTPSLADVDIVAGVYEEIEMKLDKIDGSEEDDAGAPLLDETDPMFGKSIYVKGTDTGTISSGEVTNMPFTMTFEFDETFELTGAGDTSVGFEVVPGSPNPILIAFRMATWLDFTNPDTNEKSMDFSKLVAVDDGAGNLEIRLDEKSDIQDNKDIRETIKENVKESADYGKDKDGDGELESDEDDDPDTEDENDD